MQPRATIARQAILRLVTSSCANSSEIAGTLQHLQQHALTRSRGPGAAGPGVDGRTHLPNVNQDDEPVAVETRLRRELS